MEDYVIVGKVHSEDGYPIQLDVFLPKEKLAFEYQGQHHFESIRAIANLEQQKQRDTEKREACQQKEITLIEVPYWWDKQRSSLELMIRKEDKVTQI